ncbi:MAG: aminotransferase class III-fold pyridoxal phosphate-dependent enzyme, partial [Pseudomonadota bacterium]|nr:aminotransferase class III-fold pyridoxal phosphate-dependent enzyme [Pseudomonadota bacterium]
MSQSSEELFGKARERLAGGVSHESRFKGPFPKYIERAEGSRKYEVDGKEYVDYAMGSASLLLGHAHPKVVAELTEQAAKGTFFADCHPLEIEWAGL